MVLIINIISKNFGGCFLNFIMIDRAKMLKEIKLIPTKYGFSIDLFLEFTFVV
jgi:hypothetical protein